jgi:hypothetical protein
MRILASEIVRELPTDPLVFGLFTFGIFVLLLYVVLRLDK